ncbi:MAG: hypothetical protein HFG65_00010 [Hungatella sp.]|nr:hypothetical protein [Hungatella sp.]
MCFTADGTESDNRAVKATAEEYQGKRKHIITSKSEHHAVLHTCEYLDLWIFYIFYFKTMIKSVYPAGWNPHGGGYGFWHLAC